MAWTFPRLHARWGGGRCEQRTGNSHRPAAPHGPTAAARPLHDASPWSYLVHATWPQRRTAPHRVAPLRGGGPFSVLKVCTDVHERGTKEKQVDAIRHLPAVLLERRTGLEPATDSGKFGRGVRPHPSTYMFTCGFDVPASSPLHRGRALMYTNVYTRARPEDKETHRAGYLGEQQHGGATKEADNRSNQIIRLYQAVTIRASPPRPSPHPPSRGRRCAPSPGCSTPRCAAPRSCPSRRGRGR